MSELRTGRVIRVDAKVCHVDLEGEVVLAAPRGTLFEDLGERKNPVAVGDRVSVSVEGDPAGIEEVLERDNYLGRTASSHDPREQVLFANVDQLFVITSVKKPEFSSHRTDRILAACEWHEIPAALVLNKIDLGKQEELDALRATYEAIPIPVYETCATDGRGIEELAQALRDRTTVFYGPSGGGKSTIANRLQPGLNLREGRVSKYWKQGRHTTSFSQLYPLDMGGALIDTPGIRAFRLHDVGRNVLRDLFPDFLPFQEECRYPGCTHDHEPECAVCDAVEEGRLAVTRYASYVEMLDEADPDLAYEPEEEEGEVGDLPT